MKCPHGCSKKDLGLQDFFFRQCCGCKTLLSPNQMDTLYEEIKAMNHAKALHVADNVRGPVKQ